MTDLSNLAQTVIDTLKDTMEYKEYTEALNTIAVDRDLYYKVRELQQKNFIIHSEGGDDMVERMDALTKEYEDVIYLDSVSNYLLKEAEICRLMQEFTDTVTKGLEIE